MKRYLVFLVLFAFAFSAFSQSLYISGDTLISGDPCVQLTSHLSVANQSNKTIDVRCRIVPLSNTGLSNNPPAEFSFCWGGACYGSGTDTSILIETLAAGQFIEYPDLEAHSGYFDAFCNISTAEIQYCFYDDANPIDETCFKVSFNANVTNIDDQFGLENISNFFPNPSNEYTNIQFNKHQDYIVEIVDVLGNQVKTITVDQLGKQKIFVGDLANGIYFGRITIDKKLLAIKKLIIKR